MPKWQSGLDGFDNGLEDISHVIISGENGSGVITKVGIGFEAYVVR